MAQEKGKVIAKIYRGMPHVELAEKENVPVRLELNENLSKKAAEIAAKGPISISLESLDIEMHHNQSFGMVRASTGCVSNPGGPSC
jgi:hypothetical protein